MAAKTSIFSLLTLTFMAILTHPVKPLDYPEELMNHNFFDDLQFQAPLSPASVFDPFSVLSPSSSPLAPALFVIGDSSVDCGNNNFLGTFARADRPPYGRDFDTHRPSGRFSNGRVPVDYLALRLGLPFVPSYLEQAGKIEDMIHGVNYASAGAGIIVSSGSDLVQHISFAQQIQQVTDTSQQLMISMGEETAVDLISNSIFYISIGTNDYIHYYLRNVSSVQSLHSPSSFSHLLSATLKQGIKNLYTANVRKVVVMGVAPMGCSPHYLWRYKSANGECIQDINAIIMEFNFAVRSMVEELSQEHPDAKIIFCDQFAGVMDVIQNHERHGYSCHAANQPLLSSESESTEEGQKCVYVGFSVASEACCGLGKYKGWIMCMSPEMACRNASTHIWWDQFHPTDAVNEILADNVWSGLHSSMCYPMNMKDMITD
ncbi:hypothetical protein Cgig2_026933 [Carnegiea gigantea]|uniref:Uncharacterized protein n=1 Tax=Carnegiea gigantea TaxID=171969 RepID=A0A9Q1QR64_9CARY|nr:hypothetical protein Cgig2_026933 [Carnegiea gigantea]